MNEVTDRLLTHLSIFLEDLESASYELDETKFYDREVNDPWVGAFIHSFTDLYKRYKVRTLFPTITLSAPKPNSLLECLH